MAGNCLHLSYQYKITGNYPNKMNIMIKRDLRDLYEKHYRQHTL